MTEEVTHVEIYERLIEVAYIDECLAVKAKYPK
jgi:hypothetical protein